MSDIPELEFDKEHVEKASKWTIYFLIDLRVVFVILYVYVTAVNLISTTATAEATTDSQCNNRFDVTSRPEHLNVSVSSIDDAVLWNCRDLSETKTYYKGLYILLLIAFFLTLLLFFIVKCTVIFGAIHEDRYLKRIAVIQCLEELKEKNHLKKIKAQEEINLSLEGIEKFLEETSYNLDKFAVINISCYHRYCYYYRRLLLFFSVLIVVMALGLSLLFYDLHVLSCVFEPSDDFIEYKEAKQAVEIQYSDNLSLSQKIAGGVLFALFILFFINCFFFYHCTSLMIHRLKDSLKIKCKQANKTMSA